MAAVECCLTRDHTKPPHWLRSGLTDRPSAVTNSTGVAMNPQNAERELNELAARAGQGSQEAISELLRRVRPMVVRYCRARLGRTGGGAYTTADDVAQEVCLAVLNALPRYRDLG